MTCCGLDFLGVHFGATAAGHPALLLREGAELLQTQQQAHPERGLDEQLELELEGLLAHQFGRFN